ncbi:MAG TPA: hypothetical protein VGR07_00610 [Thermoanaerobaculia bacterium]|jgi:plasmid stability protein|nr:hypothetical protein [Thermoanaerobaculia bacterium]
MQYTIRNVPSHLDRALRERAREVKKSLNEVALEALLQGTGLQGAPLRRRDLGDVAGTWVEDPEIDEALADQRRIDPELWR